MNVRMISATVPKAFGVLVGVLAACSVATAYWSSIGEFPTPDAAAVTIEEGELGPRILFVTEPTILIQFDGPPVLREELGSMRVVNTRSLAVFYEGAYWVWVGDRWFRSTSADGVLDEANQFAIPTDVDAARILFGDDAEDTYSEEMMTLVDDDAVIVGATTPTALVTLRGPAVFEPIPGTTLERITNADTEVLHDSETNVWHVALAGRWLKAVGPRGPWSFERSPIGTFATEPPGAGERR